ncbi:MAG: OmpA family protein [Deltaproteobacteria bacterium]
MKLALLLVLGAGAPALASPLDVQLVGQVVQGKGKPAVIVVAHVAVKALELELARSGCGPSEVHRSMARLPAGREARFELDQPVGRCDYEGTLSATIEGERAQLPLHFSAEVAGPPAVTPASDALDEANHVVHVTFNREADRARVRVVGEDGTVLGNTETELGDAAAGTVLAIPYEAAGTPLAIEVTVTDPTGLFGGVALYPWRLSIPHQEIEFSSGSAEVPPAEAHKLSESLGRIAAELRKIGGRAPVRLFVVGYTDTVGTSAHNAELSLARARSIGAWFLSHGLRVPVRVAGMGEEALAVATPDETPEARNRRAEYILAVDPPPLERAARPPAWEPLR